MRTSSRGIERGCFRIWQTFPVMPLRFCALNRGHDWSSGSIAAATIGWLATPADKPETIVGGAGVQLQPILPRPVDTSTIGEGRQAIIVNVFTEPEIKLRSCGSRHREWLSLPETRQRRSNAWTL